MLQPIALAVERKSIPAASVSLSPPLTVDALFERWAAYNADKRARNTIKRYRASFRSLAAFTHLRDARGLTADDLFAWAELRRDVDGVSPRAINKNDLVAVSSVLQWATGRSGGRILPDNPARGLSLDEPRIVGQRERTFREHEITAILRAASAVVQEHDNIARSAARRWCPWLAAYSGARIAELTSLVRQDVRIDGGIPVMDLRITKTGEPRTVPLHNDLIEQGFLRFVEASEVGPLFFDFKRHKANAETSPAEQQAKAVAKWVRATVKLDPGVDPNHGWRHTFKTRALGAGIEERLRDAITGHRVASVGRRYETPSLSMLSRAIERFPRYDTSNSTATQ
ncbi:integrase [Methylorubrum extorquens]